MPARLLILLVAALLAVVPVACGGDDAGDEDVATLLEQTFTGDKEVDSGRLALEARVDAEGNDQVQGPVTLKLGGPFQRGSDGELPEFQLDATLTVSDVDYEFGATSAGDDGFVRFQGEDYVLSREVFEQFKSGFEDARDERSADDDKLADLATLGIDPRGWLTDARNEGSAQVGDTETIKITGDVDVPKLLDDVSDAAGRARELDPDRQDDEPRELTEEEKRQITEAVQRMSVEIYTGREDKILRRIVIDADVEAAAGTEEFDTADIHFDYSILDLNEDQEISAPANPRPFEELARQLEGLGLFGSRTGESGGDGPSRRELERYTDCVQQAGEDEAAVQECADLL